MKTIIVALGIALLGAVGSGCVGEVGVDGAYFGPGFVEPEVDVVGPPIFFDGGWHERGHHYHDYGRRGAVSRGYAHPGARRHRY